ncbi:hypothetical protein CL620_06315, partial [archaeon]|nr:hypothetical protein [archaeon]
MYKKRGVPKEYRGFLGDKKLLIAITTLIGTIVGAGILGIPYAVAKAGFLPGLAIIIVLGLVFLLLNLFAGEIILRTKKKFQLTGYAEKYLGKTGKYLMTFSLLISIYGALTAYLIGEGATLYALIGFGSPMLWTFVFFIIASFIVLKGIKATGRTELVLIGLLILVVAAIGIFSFTSLETSYLTGIDWTHLFLPYGVVLFAYMALPVMPELQEELGKHKKKLKTAIIAGSIIPIVLYAVFTFVVVGVVGVDNFSLLEPNERIASIALTLYANPLLGTFASVLAVLAMFTSYLTLAIALIDMYHIDYTLPKWTAAFATFAIPLAAVLFNVTTFIGV